jgi:hypothetical protein
MPLRPGPSRIRPHAGRGPRGYGPAGEVLFGVSIDGKPAPGNPMAGKVGTAAVPVIDPPADTEKAKTAPVIRTYAFPGPNMTPSETWTSGHRIRIGQPAADWPDQFCVVRRPFRRPRQTAATAVRLEDWSFARSCQWSGRVAGF